MSASRELDADVAIVGCGPGRARARPSCSPSTGRSVVVLEQWPAPYPLPRAVHFDHEVGRILQSCGIGDELPADQRAGRGLRVAQRRRARRCCGSGASARPVGLALLVDVLPARRRGAARVAGPARCSASTRRGVRGRPRLEPATTTHVAVEPARRASTVAGRVRRRVRRRQQHGARPARRARWTISGFFYDWLIVDVILDEPRVFDPINLQICDPAGPTTAVSGGPGPPALGVHAPARRTLEELDEEPRPGSCSRRGTCTPATPSSNATPSTRSTPASPSVAGRPRLPRRRRRPPDAALRRSGHVRRHSRRRQPGLEARPRARRPGRDRAARHLRAESAGRARRRHRVLHRARQGHLRARPRRGGRP